MEKTLFVGPWIGEFGWELCQWQGYARKAVHQSDFTRVIVGTYPGHEGMYLDFATEFVSLPAWFLARKFDPDVIGAKGCFQECERVLAEEMCRGLGSHSRLAPCRVDLAVHEQEWAEWGRECEIDRDLVVLVRRRRTFDVERNWPEAHWEELAQKLRGEGFKVALADDEWDQSVDLFSRCALAVGGSTGGMHLASLCRCPHLVWGGDGMLKLKERYTTLWNPHRTPCRVLETGWLPSVECILKEVRRATKELARK